MQSPIWTEELDVEERAGEQGARDMGAASTAGAAFTAEGAFTAGAAFAPVAAFTARTAEDIAVRIGRFAHPATRLLLSADGLTTTLLRAWTGAEVGVLRAAQRRVPVAETPWGAGELLGAGGGERVVRHSVLGGADGSELSRNVVVARPELCPSAERCLADTSAPLGPMLQAAGTGYRRSLLDAGLRSWEPCGEPAAYKTYLLWHGDLPFAVISELFDPAVVPAALR
ncbi:hypothetical protein DF268_14505 [Streptomyces sp. V2]|uniref:hypothetical protein n=1 Tax=Streptomyces sp. V2 TaxID=1424099 RepID=UPI000D671106|nr:hypothetical protein [Streptomyces sp. V2]PWG12883.1 hypothetical protein DF268_14505 [Streptomyces sp. V2]